MSNINKNIDSRTATHAPAAMTREQRDTLELALGYIGSSTRDDRLEHTARIRKMLDAAPEAVTLPLTEHMIADISKRTLAAMKAENVGFSVITNEAFELRFAHAILAAAEQARTASPAESTPNAQAADAPTDDEIAAALEAAGVEWQWIGSPNRADRRMTCGSIDADAIFAGVRAVLAASGSTAKPVEPDPGNARNKGQAVVIGWANSKDLADTISDAERQSMFECGLPGALAAQKYSIPIIDRA